MNIRSNANNAPLVPSLSKIAAYTVSTTSTEIPDQNNDGIDIRQWLAILIAANSRVPAVGNGASAATGATVKIRLWRWRERATGGAGRPGGQWHSDIPVTLSLNGDTDLYPMEKVFYTRDAEKIYLEIEEINDDSGNLTDFTIDIFGQGPKRGEGSEGLESVSISDAATSSGGTTALVAATDPTDASTAELILINSDYELIASSDGLHDVTTEDGLSRVGAVATDNDPTDVADQDDVHLVATLDGKLINAGYNRVGDYNRAAEIDPLNQQYVNDKVAEETNVGAGTTNYYLDLDAFRKASFQLELTPGSNTITIKFYGTIQDDDPDLTARTYQDVTLKAYSAGSFTVSDTLPDTDEFWGNYTAVKIEVVIAGEADDSSYRIDSKRLY